MKRLKTIFITLIIFLSSLLVYMIMAGFINISYLYPFSLLALFFLCVISIVIGLSKNNIAIYRDRLSKAILIFALIALGFTNIGISKLYTERLKDTGYYTLSNYAKALLTDTDENNIYEKYEDENLTILYRKYSEPAIELINQYIKEVKNDAEEIYKGIEYDDLTIKITDPETFNKDLIVTDFTGGYYYEDLNQIKIPVEDAYEDVLALDSLHEFRFLVRHEYTHYASHMYREKENIPREEIPIWFEEGVASFVGAEGMNTPESMIMDEIIPFEELDQPEEWQEVNGYEQSYRMIYVLVYEKGIDVLEDILISTKDMTFNEAFEKETGKTIKYYEEELEKYNLLGWEAFPKINSQLEDLDKNQARIEGLKEYLEKNPENQEARVELEEIEN